MSVVFFGTAPEDAIRLTKETQAPRKPEIDEALASLFRNSENRENGEAQGEPGKPDVEKSEAVPAKRKRSRPRKQPENGSNDNDGGNHE